MRIKVDRIRIFSIVLFLTGLFSFVQEGIAAAQVDNIGKFLIEEQILMHVRESYVDTVSSATLMDAAIQGMIDKLDPHSSYLPPEEAKDFTEKIQGEFSGIGITFSVINGKITVIEVIDGGPSSKAGLRCRDKIVKINGTNAVGILDDSVKANLRGPKGSSVLIGVERPGETSIREIKITRDDIELNSVSHSYMLDETTGYVALSRFSIKSAVDVGNALESLRKKGMKRLVLDLRNNSGGSLDAAVGVVDCFIKKGPIVETRGKECC